MKFEKYKTYWCIAPHAIWSEELPVVKPWQGELHINQADMGMAWTMHPVDSLKNHYSLKNVYINSKDVLFHTEEEARAVYIQSERARLADIMETVADGYEALAEFVNEK